MLELKIKAVNALLIGLWICALCALFPPRRSVDRLASAPRGFLFSSKIQWSYGEATFPGGQASQPYYPSTHVEIDAGRLTGECLLALSLSALIALYYLREFLWWKKEEQENTPVNKS